MVPEQSSTETSIILSTRCTLPSSLGFWLSTILPSKGGLGLRPNVRSNLSVKSDPWVCTMVTEWSIKISAVRDGTATEEWSMWLVEGNSGTEMYSNILMVRFLVSMLRRSTMRTWPLEFSIHQLESAWRRGRASLLPASITNCGQSV